MPAASTRDAIQRTAARYRGCDKFTRYYVACKLRMDPVHRAVLDLARAAPFGRVIDAGCGRGQLAVALMEDGGATSILCMDRDARALTQLRMAANGLALQTVLGDLASHQPDAAETVLLIDVLYQLPSDVQLDLLRRVAEAAGRRVIIRTGNPAGGWRSGLSHALERIGRGIWPTYGERFNPLPIARLVSAVEGLGFMVRQEPCSQGTPFASVLLVADRITPRPAS